MKYVKTFEQFINEKYDLLNESMVDGELISTDTSPKKILDILNNRDKYLIFKHKENGELITFDIITLITSEEYDIYSERESYFNRKKIGIGDAYYSTDGEPWDAFIKDTSKIAERTFNNFTKKLIKSHDSYTPMDFGNGINIERTISGELRNGGTASVIDDNTFTSMFKKYGFQINPSNGLAFKKVSSIKDALKIIKKINF